MDVIIKKYNTIQSYNLRYFRVYEHITNKIIIFETNLENIMYYYINRVPVCKVDLIPDEYHHMFLNDIFGCIPPELELILKLK